MEAGPHKPRRNLVPIRSLCVGTKCVSGIPEFSSPVGLDRNISASMFSHGSWRLACFWYLCLSSLISQRVNILHAAWRPVVWPLSVCPFLGLREVLGMSIMCLSQRALRMPRMFQAWITSSLRGLGSCMRPAEDRAVSHYRSGIDVGGSLVLPMRFWKDQPGLWKRAAAKLWQSECKWIIVT